MSKLRISGGGAALENMSCPNNVYAGFDSVAFQKFAAQEDLSDEGVNIKDGVLHLAQPGISSTALGSLIRHLECYYGLRVSFCTAIAQRVPLRRVIADFLPDTAGTLTNPEDIESWRRIRDEYGALDKLLNTKASLHEWVVSFDSNNLRSLLHRLLYMALGALRLTGLDSDGKYCTLLWLQDGVEKRLRVPASEDTRWVSILKDTDHTATFAYITRLCLVSDESPCRGLNPKWPNRIYFLETAIFPQEGEGLCHGRVYYFTMDGQTLWVEARSTTGSKHVPNELVCLNFARSFFWGVAKCVPLLGGRYVRNQMLWESNLSRSGSLTVRIKGSCSL